MKRVILGAVCACSIILFTSATSNYPSKFLSDHDPAVFKLMEVVYLWDLLKEGYEPDRESDATWLYEGFRSKYAIAKKYASLEMLETAFGVPVFNRGPHGKDMDFNSKTAFGYYNPEFISRLHDALKIAFNIPVFKSAAQKFYRANLKDMAHIYHDTYEYLHSDFSNDMDKYRADYLQSISTPEGTSEGSMQGTFDNFDIRKFDASLNSKSEKEQSFNYYDSATAAPFWVRRSIDKTDRKIFDLLDFVVAELK